MNGIRTVQRSRRSTRLRALAPRLLASSVVLILCVAGLRAILAGPAEPVASANVPVDVGDPAAEAFAEGFARAYLTWDSAHPETREDALVAYLPSSVDSAGGLSPAPETRQDVIWATAMAARRSGYLLNVTVAAQTSRGEMLHLTVPVARDKRGFLSVPAYPALVGAPPLHRDASLPVGDDVTDEGLEVVVRRALANYLGGARENLSADLTPDAVVSLPARRMTVTSMDSATWVAVNRRVAVEVDARDEIGNSWSLRYELDVRERDRWYVRGIEVNPTLEGGG